MAAPVGGWGVNLPLQEGDESSPPVTEERTSANTDGDPPAVYVDITLTNGAAPAAAKPPPTPPLPRMALPPSQRDQIHGTVWEVARLFGFQTFNKAPTPPGGDASKVQWTPASAFVAADHLASLLLQGVLRLRGPQPAAAGLLPDDNVFTQAVFQLHSVIFQSYGVGWCPLVRLHPIPKVLLERRDKLPALSAEACHMLLCELALYFLIYTEAANVRHMPEASWFLWWCCAHTVAFIELCCSSGVVHVPAVRPATGAGDVAEADLRDKRVRCRNAYQVAIASSQQEANFDPSKQLPSACFPADRQHRSAQMPGMLAAADTIAAYLATEGQIPTGDLAVVTELALNGDGGFWSSHIITPIFLLLAQEMESLHFEDHYHRLGYDDVNESFSNYKVVHAVLERLGVTSGQRKEAIANSTFTAMAVWIGSPRCLALLGKSFGGPAEQQRWLSEAAAAAGSGAPTDQWFLPTRAAAFWSAELATKTFQERRSWLAIYRAYYRVFMINLVAFHIMMAQSLTESWDWLPLSTAVLTHAGLQALERYANWSISSTSTSKTQRHDNAKYGIRRPWFWGRPKLPAAARRADAEDPATADAIPSDFRATRLLRKSFDIEGAPIWGIFGYVEWLVLFGGLVTLFVMQLYAPDSWATVVTREQLNFAWQWTAVGYAGLNGLHFILTTRPGYCISLSHSLYMPGIVCASSCRPDPNCWVAGSLAVNFGSWLVQVLTWSCIWAAKWSFEFFLVARPLAQEIHSLLEFNICDTYLNRSGMCLDISWVLVVVTMAPFVCLVLTDGMVAYHAYLTLTCLCASLLRLNYASLPEWDECVREFHRAPARWWKKCMSSWGRDAAKNDTDLRYQPVRYGTSTSGAAGEMPSRPATASTTAAAEMARLGTIRRAITRGVAADLEKTAQFEAFSKAWDALVSDLREGDLLTDSESRNCSFARLHPEGHGWAEWPEAAVFVGPVVLPAFFFAGQVQRVVDMGRVSAVQAAVLEQMRSLGLLLAVDLGLLSGSQANAVQACPFIAKPTSHEHLEARAKTLPAAVKLVTALLSVAQGKWTPADGAKSFTDALRTLTEGLEVECRAAGGLTTHNEGSWRNNIKKLGSKSQKAALALDVLLELQQAARSTGALAECLKPLVPPKPGMGGMSRPHGMRMGPGAPGATSSPLARELVQVLHAMLTVPSAATCPGNSEAKRIISTFLNSLSLGSLGDAPSLTETRSLTVMTPLYGEDVLYCLEAEEAARNMKVGGADPAAAARGMTDLLTPPGSGSSAWEQQGAVTLLTYLRGVYQSDWDCFRERIARLALAAADAATKAASGGEPSGPLLAGVKPERIRAHLKRGYRAIHDYDFRVGGVLAPWALELQLWASFRAQVLARTARGMLCCERALRVLAQLEHPRPLGMSSHDYEAWLQQLSDSKFTYLVAAQAYGKQRASTDLKDRWMAHCIEVLLGKYQAMRVAYLDTSSASVLIRSARDGSGGIEEVYRVRLPVNPYNAGRGVVVGEGKPENQNHATIFAFGEALQTIDMNQDGCLAEALKTRNLLAELSPVAIRKDLWSGSKSKGRSNGKPPSALEVLRGLRSVRLHGPTPTAVCGFKEWIFSHKAGALASFAASTEYAFATIIQSDMARGNVRLHYGHPDVFDKLHCMTRGGVSKATRGLHVSEDVMGGLNHVLRGAKVKYTEAISCGKGRDMGFNSVLQFELKISSGNGEVMLTRDMARLAPRMDVFRLLHFYHSGLGYFVTARMLLLGIYCQALALTAVSLAGHELVNTNIQLAIQIGLVSSLPYIAQLIFETGIFNATLVFFRQLIAGVVAFTIFRMQTTAYYFTTDIMYGGASYIQTGRGFSYRPSSFVQLYASYSRSHIYLGFELGLLGVVIAACGTAGSNYGALTWGMWLVAASLMVAPIWFNPLAFNMDNVAKDWVQWRQWLQGEKDPEVQSSWSTWNRKQLAKIRDDAGQQEGHWQVALMGVAIDAVPKIILAFIAATRLTSDTSFYLLVTMGLWLVVWLLLWMRNMLLDTVRLKTWARMRTFLAMAAIALPVAFVVVVTRLYSEGSNHLFLTLYVHLMALLALHGAATHLCSGLSPWGALVDDGYWLLDCVTGTLLLSVVAILSIGGFFEKLQAVLLFNRNFARSLKDSKTSRLFAQWRPTTQGSNAEEKAAQDEQTSQQLKEAASAVGAQAAAAQAPTLRNNALSLLTQGTLRLKGLIRGNASQTPTRPQTPTHDHRSSGGGAPPSPIPSELPLTALLPGQVGPNGSPLSSLASSMRASLRRGTRYTGGPYGTEITPVGTSRLATSTSLGQELPRPRWEEPKNYSDRRQE